MPRTLGVLPSGNTLRVKKTFLNKMLTDEMAKNIGMNQYYPYVRKALGDILRALDVQLGRPLMATNLQNLNKEPDEMLTGERKPRIDLFRTCVAAIPRLIPDGMSKNDLIDLLSRLTIHMDEEMNVLAFQSLQTLVVDFVDWREDVIEGFVHFILYEISDAYQELVENSLRMLFQLMTSWKNSVQPAPVLPSSTNKTALVLDTDPVKLERILNVLNNVDALALVMLCYCRQPTRRLAAYILKESRTIHNLLLSSLSEQSKSDTNGQLNSKKYDEPVASVIDAHCPEVVRHCFSYMSTSEKATVIALSYQIDLQWLAERAGSAWVFGTAECSTVPSKNGTSVCNTLVEDKIKVNHSLSGSVKSSHTITSGHHQEASCSSSTSMVSNTGSCNNTIDRKSSNTTIASVNTNSLLNSANLISENNSLLLLSSSNSVNAVNYRDELEELKLNAWNVCMMEFMNQVTKQCFKTLSIAWPIICHRLNSLSALIDPNQVNENRTSILRGSNIGSNPKKVLSSYDRSFYLDLWKNYLMFACRIAPSSNLSSDKSASSLPENCISPDSSLVERLSSRPHLDGSRSPILHRQTSSQTLFKQVLPLIRADQTDLLNTVITGLSQVNQFAFSDFLECLAPYLREVVEKKQENLRRRKRKEMLRVQVGHLLRIITERNVFSRCPVLVDSETKSLCPILLEYIDGMRSYFETEADKDSTSQCTQDIKESMCHFVCNLIKAFPNESRGSKLSCEMRKSLFNLYASWSGKFGSMFISSHYLINFNQMLDFSSMTELEYLAIKSMSVMLCSGPVFDAKHLESKYFHFWLINLLNVNDKRLNDVGLETLILLLENNIDESGFFLDWLIDCCYTKMPKIADLCFTALATIFAVRDYSCDRYIAIIIVAIVNVACPRIEIQQLALQLLQVLDNRFFSSPYKNILPNSTDPRRHRRNSSNVDSVTHVPGYEPLLLNLYPCSQYQISKRMAYLHPQLMMIVFSEITFRFTNARLTVCQNLLNLLVPWLYNMQLVDPITQGCDIGASTSDFNENDPSASINFPHSFSKSSALDDDQEAFGSMYKEGWGSVESTEMVLNNLFYVTIKYGEDYFIELECVWAALCSNRPNNLKIIIRYLFILISLSPNEMLPYAKRIAIYLAKSQPEFVIDQLMTELQAVELLSFNAERTEAFPFFRIVNRKCSASHLDSVAEEDNKKLDQSISLSQQNVRPESGMIHTKRHSKDLHNKYEFNSSNDPSGKISEQLVPKLNCDSFNESGTSSDDCNVVCDANNSADTEDLNANKPPTPLPRPLPMPEYGGYYAPLNQYLLNSSCPTLAGNGNPCSTGLYRCNFALMLLCDLVTQDIQVDWSVHVPLMLHVLFLGMDHSKPLVFEHCKQLLLNLLIVTCNHKDNLTISRILLNNLIIQQNYGLSMHNFTGFPEYKYNASNLNESDENDPSNDSNDKKQQSLGSDTNIDLNQIFINNPEKATPPRKHIATQPKSIQLTDIQLNMINESDAETGDECEQTAEEKPAASKETPSETASNKKRVKFSLDLYIKTFVDFISKKTGTQLWNYEDITAKVWSIKSADQMCLYVDQISLVFRDSLPYARIVHRWADIALQLSLSCSSRHYAGRSLQIFRALHVPINSRMLSDILSRLVETVSEQGEDMQGYVTELMLTLESAIDSFEFKPRNIFDLINEYFQFEFDVDEFDPDPCEIEKSSVHECSFEKPIGEDNDLIDPLSMNDNFSGSNTVNSTGSTSTLVNLGKDQGLPSSQSHFECSTKRFKLPCRTASYSMSFPTRKSTFQIADHNKPNSSRFRTITDVDSFYNLDNSTKCNSMASLTIARSQSAQSLKHLADDSYTPDDRNSMLAQFFWISVIMLETDYEHEFLLALRVFDKVLQHLDLEDPECQEKIDKIFVHFKWPSFPGVHALMLKGCYSPQNYEPTISLLHKLTPFLKVPVIDPSKSENAFPFLVMAILPYMLHNYDDPTSLCIEVSQMKATI